MLIAARDHRIFSGELKAASDGTYTERRTHAAYAKEMLTDSVCRERVERLENRKSQLETKQQMASKLSSGMYATSAIAGYAAAATSRAAPALSAGMVALSTGTAGLGVVASEFSSSYGAQIKGVEQAIVTTNKECQPQQPAAKPAARINNAEELRDRGWDGRSFERRDYGGRESMIDHSGRDYGRIA